MRLETVGTTQDYRKLALNPQAWGVSARPLTVVEVGCAHGVTSRLLAKNSGVSRLICCDIQEDLVNEAQTSYSSWSKGRNRVNICEDTRFLCCDVSRDGVGGTDALCEALLPEPKVDVVFLDIAGTISIKTLLDVLDHVQKTFRPMSMIVKSIKLNRLAHQLANGDGALRTVGLHHGDELALAAHSALPAAERTTDKEVHSRNGNLLWPIVVACCLANAVFVWRVLSSSRDRR